MQPDFAVSGLRTHPPKSENSCWFQRSALILAINARTQLVTFHGPNGLSWRPAQTEYFRVLFAAEPVTFQNLKDPDDDNRLMRNTAFKPYSGRVQGRLIGGNLSVFLP